jgi:hypothetical protein
MWPSLCGGKRLKPFCPEKFVVYKSDLGKCGGSSCIFLKTFVLLYGGETDKGPGEGGSKRGTACTWRFNKHDHECDPTNCFVAADTASSFNLRSFFTEELKRKQNVYTYFPVCSKCFMFSIYWTAPKISHQQRQFNIEQSECVRPHSVIKIADCSRQVTCFHFTAALFGKFTAPLSFWYTY